MEQEQLAPEIRFIRLRDALSICGMSCSAVYDAIKKGKLPAPVKLSAHFHVVQQFQLIAPFLDQCFPFNPLYPMSKLVEDA